MDYLKLFHKLDQQGGYSPYDKHGYQPIPEEILGRARLLHARIEGYLGQLVRGGVTEFQDATYHGNFLLPTVDDTDAIMPWLRLSNFGNLATIFAESHVPPDTVAAVKSLLQEMGYTYIPEDIASQEYVPANAADRAARELSLVSVTWGDRFFSEQ